MSAREWKPGDVALVCNEYGIWNVAICTLRAEERGWWWRFGVADSWLRIGDAVARPLVAIDLENAETLDALGKAWDEAESCDLDNEQPMTIRALRMRIALRSLIAGPKPDEPQGLGAVVEATNGDLWVRLDTSGVWACASDEHKTATYWPTITAVRVLSEGITL